MNLDIILLPEAEEQAAERIGWWREHRPAAPYLLEDELERTLERLAANPHLGRPYKREGSRVVRRYHLKKTPHLVYYEADLKAGVLRVLSVWSAMIKDEPPL